MNSIAQIVNNIELIFKNVDYIHHSNSGGQVILANISQEALHLGIIKLQNGYLAETSYPERPDVHNRLWMVEPQLLNISYLELTNPDLINNIAFDFYGNTSPNLEMHAMPEDIHYLQRLLAIVLSDINLYLISPLGSNILAELSHPTFVELND